MLNRVLVGLAVVTLTSASAAAEFLIGLAASLTGPMAWLGEQHEQALKAAAPELKVAEEAIGEPIRTVIVDDFCKGEQAVAAVRKLVEDGALFIGGHACSGAAIPASAVYDEARVLMISSTATNPALTDAGSPYVFRVGKRDTEQAAMVVERLAEHGAAAVIAIVHDGEAYGQGLAEASLAMLAERGVEPVIYDAVASGQTDFKALLDRLEAARVDVLFFGGYPPEAGLLIRQARDRGLGFEMIGVDSLASEYFWHVAGEAAEGVRFPSLKDLRPTTEAAEVVERFRAQGYEPEGFTLYNFAVFEVWSQAVRMAGTADPDTIATMLREETFATVLGTIGFEANGDVTGYEPFAWFIWQGGDYVPLDPAAGE